MPISCRTALSLDVVVSCVVRVKWDVAVKNKLPLERLISRNQFVTFVLPLLVFAIIVFATNHSPAGQIMYIGTESGSTIKKYEDGLVSDFVTSPLFNAPGTLAVGQDGTLYVSNYNDNAIFKVSPSGTVNTITTLPGPADVSGLAIDHSGNIYASMYGGGKIVKITPAGITSDFAFTSLPARGVFDSSGNFYVRDSVSANMKQYSPTGTLIGYHSSSVLNHMFDLAIDSQDNIYNGNAHGNPTRPTPNSNAIIKTPQPFGTPSVLFVPAGGAHPLSDPYSLAFDSGGNLWVTSLNNNIINQYNSSGVYLSSITLNFHPGIIAFSIVPEPSTGILAIIAGAFLLRRVRKSAWPTE
jgi:sugar lactone lactonase YvrE